MAYRSHMSNMEYSYASDNDDLSMEEDHAETRHHGKRKRDCVDNIDDSQFKSKNLAAERRRRAKLNDRLLELRTAVPIITNMTKATIIKDAISYIEELQREVSELSDELLDLGKNPLKEEMKPVKDDRSSNEEMKSWGIEPDVKVIAMDDNKIWVKVVYQKTMGGLTKLVEAITRLGFQFNDTNFTTSKRAAVINSCLEGVCGGSPDIEETKERIMSLITSMQS